MSTFLIASVLAATGLTFSSEAASATSAPAPGPHPAGFFAPEQSIVAPQDTSSAVVSGRVFSAMTGAPLPFAVVEVVSASASHSVICDRNGRYWLEGVRPGARLIRAQALDHEALVVEVSVPPGSTTSLDLSLAVEPIMLEPLSAKASAPGEEIGLTGHLLAAETRRATAANTKLRMLESSPGVAELGLAQIARTTPGPNPNDPSSILYVRGATSDLKLVLLDGAPVFAPFHLGGLIEAVQPGVLGSSRLFQGGAPARYDGGLTYILDLDLREGETDRFHTAGALDLMSARAQIEGPIGSGSYLIGGRAVHGAGPTRFTGAPLPYEYGDAIVRLNWGIGSDSEISATGFWNHEAVDLASETDIEEPASWGNIAGSLRYRTPLADSELQLTAATGEFITTLPVGGNSSTLVDGRSRRLRIEGLVSRAADRTVLEYGVSYDRVSLRHDTVEPATADEAADTDLVALASGEAVGAFAEAAIQVAPTFLVRGGLRANHFFADGFRVAPRLSAAWSFVEGAELAISAGRYYQHVLSTESALSSEIGGISEIATEETAESRRVAEVSTLGVSNSTHLVVGLSHEPIPQLTIGVEGFIKSFRDLPEGPDLNSSGLDIWIQRSAASLSGWIGYSVAWYRPDGSPTEQSLLGRHLVTGGLSTVFWSGIGLDLRLSYGAGLPFQPIPRTESSPGQAGTQGPNAGNETSVLPSIRASRSDGTDQTRPLAGAEGSYMRVDGKLFRTWSVTLDGVAMRITPYVKILNALDRRDALFFQFNPDRDIRPVSLGAVPLIPLFGVEWNI